jgi:ATP-dependent DNA ligase
MRRAASFGSLLLGLYNEKGVLDRVGFTSAFAKEDKKALTARLEKLVGRPASRATLRAARPAGRRSVQPNAAAQNQACCGSEF